MMGISATDRARAVADISNGLILASVEIAATPERVFQALASEEVTRWWIRPGVFDTREWTGEVRVGGRWRASGIGNGQPYSLEGEFLEVDPPRKLVHTWRPVGAPVPASTVSYLLEPIEGGTRVTLRHSGLVVPPQMFENTRVGWDTSFDCLVELLGGKAARAVE